MSEPILISLAIVGAVLVLAALAVAVLALGDRTGMRRRIESWFRRPPKPPKAPGSTHYYKPYWS